MNVGVLIELNKNIDDKFEELRGMGMNSCQLVCWDENKFTDEMAELVNQAVKKHEVHITAFWCGWSGPVTWDFYDGQLTLGLIPAAYRFCRLQTLMNGSDFAKKMNIRDFVTHVGYIPENPFDENYTGTLVALKKLIGKCKENGQNFLFETGQETPVTLRRAIEDIGYDNVGINLDPANLLMYGKANPVDALDILGKYVLGIHGKDGMYPTDGRNLGEEKPLGEGRVDYPKFIAKLKEIGYQGDITIEREISGEEQKKDIIKAKKILDELIQA
ncbi:sugar phosphate isomerase/epimerase family protein [Anaerocolumna sp. MB42-C2]|uniref:sugar phosphate isomerase/epimerase family protein n=1 Tax=Anaerocolumna sp. MB42-C2 TaxID=3070997 RepID=UPI0027E1524C|nr:sugar phosphate isomerase/epimerase family protein [Anaerocolumna sp. MB42-C2]WMJ90527.1 sugar phosphate isomerase/epimerase family protein [Anaerocolumna sp. MB42-C2]